MTALSLPASAGPREIREAIRRGDWTQHTSGVAPGFAQANLVILPAQYADDFIRFCLMNPRPCPVLDVTRPGDPSPRSLGDGIDLRHDLPRYRLYRHGVLENECTDIAEHWQDDFVSFSIGCSFSFEEALLNDGLDVRHIHHRRNVPMYRTNRALTPSGPFRGELVVSMRPFPAEQPDEYDGQPEHNELAGPRQSLAAMLLLGLRVARPPGRQTQVGVLGCFSFVLFVLSHQSGP